MIKVTHQYRIEGKTVGYYCYDGARHRTRLVPAELKKYIQAGQVINARLSGNKICLADGVKVKNVEYDKTASNKQFIKSAVYRMEEILTGKEKKRKYPFDMTYRRKDSIHQVAYLCEVGIEDLGERQWYSPKIQPAMDLIFELQKHKEWNCNQQIPYINQLSSIVRTWR